MDFLSIQASLLGQTAVPFKKRLFSYLEAIAYIAGFAA